MSTVRFLDPQQPNYVCKLHKSLYGLEQAPRAWFERFMTHLLSLGFHALTADPSFFVWSHSHTLIALLVYVDDILITGNNPLYINYLINQLGSTLSMKDLGPMHYFLGLEVHQTKEKLFLMQTQYALDLLQKYKMDGVKRYSSPMVTSSNLVAYDGDPLSYPSECRSVVGALQYLSWTRPDISFVINHVCPFMHNHTTVHWTAVK